MQISKKVLLKLGGDCNLNCPHCHCERTSYAFNPDVIGYIKNEKTKRLSFSGGEPLLYWDAIVRLMAELGREVEYTLVTNATLLSNEMVDILNEYQARVFASYDGEHGQRTPCDPKYALVAKIKNNGLATVVYPSNLDLRGLRDDVVELSKRTGLNRYAGAYFPNFAHQTRINPNADITLETAREYVSQFAPLLELEVMAFEQGVAVNNLRLLSWTLDRWYSVKPFKRGLFCFNEIRRNLTVSGDFLLCPYDSATKVGDIYTGVDWGKVEAAIPARCKSCELWPMCRCQCAANITDNECYIFKTLYRHWRKLVEKYGLDAKAMREALNNGGRVKR